MMRQYIDDACDYRRYCWNVELETWDKMYKVFKQTGKKSDRPTGYKVRKILISKKKDWEYGFSYRVLIYAIEDLDHAWSNYFNKVSFYRCENT